MRREIDKLYMYKKESLIKLCDIYLILLFILIVKKKILTMVIVYKIGICLYVLYVNIFWVVRLYLIIIGRIMYENGKLIMIFSFWWYLNV